MAKKLNVSKKEIENLKNEITKLSPEKKDEVVAHLIVYVQEIGKFLKKFSADVDKKTQVNLTKKQQKEIEDIVSFGPSWLKYTRKIKRKEKN